MDGILMRLHPLHPVTIGTLIVALAPYLPHGAVYILLILSGQAGAAHSLFIAGTPSDFTQCRSHFRSSLGIVGDDATLDKNHFAPVNE